jgi:hypothetical protein
MNFEINLISVKQLSMEQVAILIDQLEEAMMSNMPYEQKLKLRLLIGKVITIYMKKRFGKVV